MKQYLLAAAMTAAIPSFGLELNCVRDHRAVDGDAVRVHLVVDAQGNGTATLTHEGDSPATSFSEKVTLRAMTCKEIPGHDLNIDCTGPNKLNVSEMEIVSPGGGGFSRRIIVSTSYKNQSHTFGAGPIGTGAIKNGCEIVH
jgi:hypothetical protein